MVAGKSFFSPAVGKVLLEDYMESWSAPGRRIPELLGAGTGDPAIGGGGQIEQEIANLLSLSVYTVETHRARIMQKLNLRNIPELILYAVRKGIIS